MLLAQNTNETTGNLVFGETVRMEIDPGASGIILDSLIRIYSNPYVAALREYTSNAWDSHQEAGQTRAIEVSLPTQLSPTLVIEDFGTGMDRKQLAQFGQFGFSTKRSDNDSIGGFGLGSKVGLAFSSQYTVQAVKDGKKNVAIIGRDEDGNPQMGLLHETDTDLPNGVKITIPTTEYNKFAEALNKNFFLGFGVKAIKINGQFPEYSVHDTEEFTPLEDNLGWRRAKGAEHNVGGVALIKGVRYKIDWNEVQSDIDYTLRTGFLSEVVLDLPNGEVDIQRSRESLVYSKRTREVLAQKFEALMGYATKQYAVEIDAAETIREALTIRAKAISFGFNSPDYTWQGKKIDLKVIEKHNRNDDKFSIVNVESGGSSALGLMGYKNVETYRSLLRYYIEAVFKKKTILVTGASAPKLMRNKVVHSESFGAVQWANAMEEKGQGSADSFTIYFTSGDERHYSKWFTGAFHEVITADKFMETVTAVRKANAAGAAEARKANALLHAPTELTVRRAIYLGSGGSSSWVDTKVSNLDATKTHVLLQAGESNFTDSLRAALLTKTGYYNAGFLGTITNYLAVNENYVFLFANKSTKVSEYAGVVPNLKVGSDLPKLIEAIAKKINSGKSEIEKRAILDRASSSAYWAQRFPDRGLDTINFDNTRNWIEAMKVDNTPADAFLGLVAENADKLGIDPDVAKITTTIDSPAGFYPLMAHLSGWGADYDLVVEYINMKDVAEGRV